MRHTPLIALLVVACAGTSETPTAVPTTETSRAALLAGDYALTITLDDRCAQLPALWTYRATLGNAGRYVVVNVMGSGFSERTGVGQMYTYPDFTARFIWNFDDPDFNYPDPRIYGPRLLLYGASETKIVNGAMSGTIVGTVSTTSDFNGRCYGSHRFTLISTGR